MLGLCRVVLPALLLAACASRQAVPPPANDGRLNLTLVATNDLHGWVQPHEAKLADGRVVRSGGLATFASYLSILRAENPDGLILLDVGDIFQGTLVANLSEGAVVIAAYNALRYDAAVIGNHEFDYGPIGPKSAAIDLGDDPLGALLARAKDAKFPLLGRNAYYAEDGERLPFGNDGTALIERKGVKVGIVGVLTPLTPQVTNPVNVLGLRFGPLAEEAKAAAEELRARGAEVLIALVHAGGRCDSLDDPRSLAGCDERGEIFQMLQALPPGYFDAVMTGHTHTRLGHLVNGMPVLQSAAFGTHFGTLELEVDPATRRPVPEKTVVRSMIPICERFYEGTSSCDPKRPAPGTLVPATFHGKGISPDKSIASLLSPYLDRVAREQGRSLRVKVPRPLARNYTGESALGNALADAMREMEGTDASLFNAGGLRNDLPAGELTYGALYEIFPFDNTIATLTLTGDELIRLFEALQGSGHGAPQLSGVKVRFAICGDHPKIAEIAFTDGRPFDRSATYRLTTSDFLALGGDGVGPVVEAIPAARKDFGHRRPLNMRDALAAWFEKRGGTLETVVDGRLTVDPACPAAKP